MAKSKQEQNNSAVNEGDATEATAPVQTQPNEAEQQEQPTEQQETAEPKAAAGNTKQIATYSVIQNFRDKRNFEVIYYVGDDVTNLDAERLQTLVKKGLVKQND